MMMLSGLISAASCGCPTGGGGTEGNLGFDGAAGVDVAGGVTSVFFVPNREEKKLLSAEKKRPSMGGGFYLSPKVTNSPQI
jgi:hypothetical protein